MRKEKISGIIYWMHKETLLSRFKIIFISPITFLLVENLEAELPNLRDPLYGLVISATELNISDISDTNLRVETHQHQQIGMQPMWLLRLTHGLDYLMQMKTEKEWSETSSQNLENIKRNIRRCSTHLQSWNQTTFGKVQVKLKEARSKLAQIQNKNPTTINTNALQKAAEEVQTWMNREEIMWKQRSRAAWLEEGDQNTHFFHAKAFQRRKKIQLQNCWMIEKSRCCSNQHGKLTQPFTATEISQALHEMHPNTPGLDGMPPFFFFQKFWPHIGPSITNAALHALNTCEFSQDVNHTFITLIPKTKNPQRVKDYRPISLCNVLYKLVSKVVANTIKQVLPMVISETQSAFIKGRLISDNVLVAYEVLHFLKRKKKGKKGYMSLKLDMSKAYDRVEWSFLEAVMHKLGFHGSFINLGFKARRSYFSLLISSMHQRIG
ncbi:unnamed protein product [Fraxinus pennsylvanica]|uniref:Reverse transcriptase domain-containing protein n=1 Tax=Fraxinus pennsylvanica TaxID=56036 RepID=A0AAD1Z418_9LAMI|nr:unnamed protein product [Fraxinus pennsylvanica]